MPLKLLAISLPPSIFFTDHLKHKTVNKSSYRMPSVNNRQLQAN